MSISSTLVDRAEIRFREPAGALGPFVGCFWIVTADRGATIRENNDFYYNVADAKAAYLVAPGTRAEVGYRNTILRYDENNVSDTEDYDINAVGATLRHQALKNTVLSLEYRYESIDYDGEDRGSDSQYIGAQLEQICDWRSRRAPVYA